LSAAHGGSHCRWAIALFAAQHRAAPPCDALSAVVGPGTMPARYGYRHQSAFESNARSTEFRIQFETM
ncbi:MAG: hypothetical protein ACLGHK_03145, partial [Alphaproteobacteria bacterium]